MAAAYCVLFHPGQALAQPLCRPEIAIKKTNFTDAVNLRRYWTAKVDINASTCAAPSGLFALGFVRLSETGPDLKFTEPLTWRPGEMTVRVEFWWDEAVDRYWVADIAACPCRSK